MNITEIFQIPAEQRPSVKMPYIIAEAGVNHEGSMDLAKRLIDEAKEGGADAIKFQTYKADTIASRYSPSYWDLSAEPTTSQYELFKKYDSFWKNEFELLKKYCDDAEIEFISTPFDIESANFLNDLMPVFKISSSDITNKPFIEYICAFGKPIILSTGASYLEEIEDAVGWINQKENSLSLLHCILNYPTVDENANLGMIQSLKNHFPELAIGYSDHTLPKEMKTLEIAALLGAVILEKHFTHDKILPGNDHYHAMDKNDLLLFKKNMGNVLELVGSSEKSALPSEKLARENARRSLVVIVDIVAGQKIKRDDLTWKRPGHGISPSRINDIIGLIAKKDIVKDSVLLPGMFR